MVRIEIDPNIRVQHNWTRTGTEYADGPLESGQEVEVYESESGLTGPGRVEEINHINGFVILSVDWKRCTFPDDED